MPLTALLDDRKLIAPFLGEEEWGTVAVALRAGARLTLPCCGAVGGVRRSRRGRRFFYHRTTREGGRCAWAGETPEHLATKATIALACRRAGYTVITEARDPVGRWVADVLATPPAGGRPLAFEVQWSAQSLDATHARQAAYATAGVRGCWFFRRPPAQDRPDPALPLFGLALSAEDHPVVSSPFVLAPTTTPDDEPLTWPLEAFVAALLAGRIRFRTHVTAPARPAGRLVFFRHPCWRCTAEMLLWYVEGWTVRARSGCGVMLERRPPWHRTAVAEIAEALAPATRAVVATFVAGSGCGLPVAGTIGGGASARPGAAGFACPHCDAPIGARPLARDDAFRRARRRYRRRGGLDGPADLPPATCPLPSDPRFVLRESRPHWCYPGRDAWCCDQSMLAPSPVEGLIEEAALP